MTRAELKRLDSLAARLSDAIDWLQDVNAEKLAAIDALPSTHNGEKGQEALEEDIAFIEDITPSIEALLSEIKGKLADQYQ